MAIKRRDLVLAAAAIVPATAAKAGDKPKLEPIETPNSINMSMPEMTLGDLKKYSADPKYGGKWKYRGNRAIMLAVVSELQQHYPASFKFNLTFSQVPGNPQVPGKARHHP